MTKQDICVKRSSPSITAVITPPVITPGKQKCHFPMYRYENLADDIVVWTTVRKKCCAM